jgi:hypothetical protein
LHPVIIILIAVLLMKLPALLITAATTANVVLAFNVAHLQPQASSKKPLLVRDSTEILSFSSSSVERGDQDLNKDVTTSRNDIDLNLRCVKNARDLASVAKSPIIPNRVYRTGKLSDATSEDIDILLKQRGIRTVIDLRSPTELKEDEGLHRDVSRKQVLSRSLRFHSSGISYSYSI